MYGKQQSRDYISSGVFRAGALGLPLTIVFALILVLTQSAPGQTYSVIYSFTGGQDGAFPSDRLTIDRAGNLYGIAYEGGYTGGNCTEHTLLGCGAVFKLTKRNSGWAFSSLYNFHWGTDGALPAGGVTFGPNGSLYGTTSLGGVGWDGVDGTAFELNPSPTVCKTAVCSWTETVLYRFGGGHDGAGPMGDLLFDEAGHMYGTTHYGGGSGCGGSGCGTVYQLTLYDGWTEGFVYSFAGGDGQFPEAGVISGNAANLYGTTYGGGAYGQGVVYQLMPSDGGWTENVLYSFSGGSDGTGPEGELVFDRSGNLYGTTSLGGSGGGGTVFLLSPADGGWTFSVLYSLTGSILGANAGLAIDAAGNLYGTTVDGGVYGYGNVFKLTHSGSAWTYTSLYDFTGGTDGGHAFSAVILDANGSLFGTAGAGGTHDDGVVWEITR